jgi:hypothetical protein
MQSAQDNDLLSLVLPSSNMANRRWPAGRGRCLISPPVVAVRVAMVLKARAPTRRIRIHHPVLQEADAHLSGLASETTGSSRLSNSSFCRLTARSAVRAFCNSSLSINASC